MPRIIRKAKTAKTPPDDDLIVVWHGALETPGSTTKGQLIARPDCWLENRFRHWQEQDVMHHKETAN